MFLNQVYESIDNMHVVESQLILLYFRAFFWDLNPVFSGLSHVITDHQCDIKYPCPGEYG